MSRAAEQIKEIGRNVERLAGKAAHEKVMAGSEKLGASAKPEKIAEWAKGAMERLDAEVAKGTREEIMRACGVNCAKHKPAFNQKAKARRKKFASEEEFLEAEISKPPMGTRIEKKGKVLFHYFTPRSFTRLMRCYCGLFTKLPEGERVSATYCQCSRGFVETFWKGVLGRPVNVKVLETCLTGARECRFEVRL
jgi:hypothetical protein